MHVWPNCVQAVHTFPPKPQVLGWVSPGLMHTSFWQQPGQFVALQVGAMQEPFTHTFELPHAMQADPLIPQCAASGETQVPPAQQPLAHVLIPHAVTTQLPPTHDRPSPQAMQVFPLRPQRVVVVPR